MLDRFPFSHVSSLSPTCATPVARAFHRFQSVKTPVNRRSRAKAHSQILTLPPHFHAFFDSLFPIPIVDRPRWSSAHKTLRDFSISVTPSIMHLTLSRDRSIPARSNRALIGSNHRSSPLIWGGIKRFVVPSLSGSNCSLLNTLRSVIVECTIVCSFPLFPIPRSTPHQRE